MAMIEVGLGCAGASDLTGYRPSHRIFLYLRVLLIWELETLVRFLTKNGFLSPFP